MKSVKSNYCFILKIIIILKEEPKKYYFLLKKEEPHVEIEKIKKKKTSKPTQTSFINFLKNSIEILFEITFTLLPISL